MGLQKARTWYVVRSIEAWHTAFASTSFGETLDLAASDVIACCIQGEDYNRDREPLREIICSLLL